LFGTTMQEQSPLPENCSRCSACGAGNSAKPRATDRPHLTGCCLILPAVGLFIVPPVLAIAGAILAGENCDAQFFGAIAGLLAGIAAAVVVVGLLRRRGGKKKSRS